MKLGIELKLVLNELEWRTTAPAGSIAIAIMHFKKHQISLDPQNKKYKDDWIAPDSQRRTEIFRGVQM
jgi:hypothetical protein